MERKSSNGTKWEGNLLSSTGQNRLVRPTWSKTSRRKILQRELHLYRFQKDDDARLFINGNGKNPPIVNAKKSSSISPYVRIASSIRTPCSFLMKFKKLYQLLLPWNTSSKILEICPLSLLAQWLESNWKGKTKSIASKTRKASFPIRSNRRNCDASPFFWWISIQLQ